ncbi:hypothetical protein EBT31_02765 [bacterium]|nr:hypothetical protein [bacterium]
MTTDQWELAKARKLAGESWATIANDLQIKKATLEQRAFKTGFSKIVSKAKEVSLEKRNSPIEQSIETLSKLVRSKLAADAASTIDRIESYDLDTIRDEATREQILGSVAKRSALVFGWSDQSESATVSINLLGALPDKSLNITPTSEIE